MGERYYIVYKHKVISGPHTKLTAHERLARLSTFFKNLEIYQAD
jgi:hypothetical protein